MSSKEMKAASTAFTVAMEIAKERLGQGEYVKPGMLLRGLTRAQLDEFVRIMRELEKGFNRILADEQRHDRIAEHGGIAELIPPSDYRSIRERQRRYGDE